MSESGKQTCFVIMPFSDTTTHNEAYWTTHFEDFLKPLIEEIPGIEAVRSRPLRGDILREIITQLVTAPVVVADLTDAKPNVFWELGVRQSFKHGTVTIQEGEVSLPFDLGAKGTLPYTNNDRIKQGDFSRKFKVAIQDCLEHPERTDSHVLEAISGRGSLFEIFRKDETVRRLDALESEIDRTLLILEWVIEYCERNQNLPKGERGSMTTGRLRTSAVELLITNRYIEEGIEFYKVAELCDESAIRVNEKLAEWLHFANHTEKWLMKALPRDVRRFQQFKKLITSAREKTQNLA